MTTTKELSIEAKAQQLMEELACLGGTIADMKKELACLERTKDEKYLELLDLCELRT